MSIKRKQRLIYAEPGENSNKFYDLVEYDDGRVVSTYGRVGITSSEKDYGRAGSAFFDKTIKSKLKKGYTELKVLDAAVVPTSTSHKNQDLLSIAKSQIKFSNPALEKLIEKLVRDNVHNITNNTSIKFNTDTGLFQSPLGIVTLDAINEGREVLADLKGVIDAKKRGKDFEKLVSRYLRLIPKDLGMRYDAEQVFPNVATILKENDTLDALENSYKIAITPVATPTAPIVAAPSVFDLELDQLDPGAEYDRIVNAFKATNKAMHGYTSASIKKIYKVKINPVFNRFNQKMGNLQEVYHGSNGSNILSILKTGLKCSPPSTAAIAGKNFGNGIYGSQTASKSLGYTSFNKWGQGSAGGVFLFVCDFAMGNAYMTPSTLRNIPNGYDSCWATPKYCKTLLNDELIVYTDDKVNIKYLLEL